MSEGRRVNGITEGVIWKQLLIFFFPILFGTFFQQFYSTVDTIIVGQAVGKDALAAVGATATLVYLLIGFFTGLSSGAGVVIAQYFGGNQPEGVRKSVHTAMTMSIILGAAFTAVGIVTAPVALELMNTPPEIMDQSLGYLRVYYVGMIPTLIYNMGSGILRSVGDSRRPLYFLIAASLINIVLDLVFVAGLDMGVEGAAWATVLSQVVSAVLVIVSLSRAKGTSYRLDLKQMNMYWSTLKPILRIGLPTAFQSLMYSGSNLIVQTAVNDFGTDVIAAWTVYGKVDAIFWMAISSMGLAITTFAGQNFGAAKYQRVHRSVAVSTAMGMGMTIFCTVAFMVFAKPLFLIFNDDPLVLELGVDMIRFLAPTYVTYVCIEIFSGALRGCGDSLVPTVITCLGVCVLRIGWIWALMPVWHSMEIVMLSYPVTWLVTSVCYVVYYLRGNWLKRRIRAAGMLALE